MVRRITYKITPFKNPMRFCIVSNEIQFMGKNFLSTGSTDATVKRFMFRATVEKKQRLFMKSFIQLWGSWILREQCGLQCPYRQLIKLRKVELKRMPFCAVNCLATSNLKATICRKLYYLRVYMFNFCMLKRHTEL